MSESADLVLAILQRGGATQLRALIEGESEFSADPSTGVPLGFEERKAWVMAVHHLRFISEFGEQASAVKDGRYLTPWPEDFRRWLDFGAPGVSAENLRDCLEAMDE